MQERRVNTQAFSFDLETVSIIETLPVHVPWSNMLTTGCQGQFGQTFCTGLKGFCGAVLFLGDLPKAKFHTVLQGLTEYTEYTEFLS